MSATRLTVARAEIEALDERLNLAEGLLRQVVVEIGNYFNAPTAANEDALLATEDQIAQFLNADG